MEDDSGEFEDRKAKKKDPSYVAASSSNVQKKQLLMIYEQFHGSIKKVDIREFDQGIPEYIRVQVTHTHCDLTILLLVGFY